jgi:tetratricopeptide (TPR) repeat protein
MALSSRRLKESLPAGQDDETLPGDPGASRSQSPTSLPRGELVGRYVILRRLGGGGMGVVYAAYDPELDRAVALKLLQERFDRDSGARTRFLREAQAMARINHPNVGIVHDVGSIDGRVYLAMELVEGVTLAARSGRELAEVLRLYVAAGRGLAAAHAKGLVHRDFKPDNVMIGDDGRVRVLDFGLARVMQSDSSTDAITTSARDLDGDLTLQGELLGTVAYMSPEQLGRTDVGERSDQFSFCVALWEAIHGERPYGSGSALDLTQAFARGKLRDPVRPTPRWLQRALERGLSIDPNARWPSMDALLAELQRNRSRRRWVAGLTAGAALSCGSIAGFVVLEDRRERAACVQASQAIHTAWNEEIASASQDTLGPDASAAQGPFTRLAGGLDAYAEAWTTARHDVCLATHEGDHDDALHGSAAACLDEGLAQVSTLVSLLAEADLERLQKTISVLEKLPRPSRCLDAQWLAQRVQPPPGTQGEDIVAVRQALAEVWVLRSAGRLDEATEAAGTALEKARALAWDPLVAEAMAEVGSVELEAGTYAPAEARLREAYLLAAAAAHDEVAADTATRLTYLVGTLLHRPVDGRLWADLARASIDRLGGTDLVRRAQLHANLGSLFTDAGEHAQAEAAFLEALALMEPDHPHMAAAARSNLGMLYFNQGRYDDALEQFHRSIALREPVLGPDHPELARPLNNIGSALASKGELAEAVGYFERALAIMETSLGPEHPFVALTLGNVGGIYLHLDEPKRASEYHERAVAIFVETKGAESVDVGRARANLANTYAASDDFERARQEYQRSIEILEAKVGEGHVDLVGPLNNYGLMLLDVDDPAAAIPVFQRAVGIWAKAEKPHPGEMARSLAGLGVALTRHGEPKAAVPHLQRALELVTDAGLSPSAEAEPRWRLAQALAAIGDDMPRARELAEEARDRYRKAQGGEKEAAAVDAWLAAHP